MEGSEDLGNGYSVGFLLENGFTMDNGAAGEDGKAFSKQATLSLSGNFGELAFGRMGGLASYEGSYQSGTLLLLGPITFRAAWETRLLQVRLTTIVSFTFLPNSAV